MGKARHTPAQSQLAPAFLVGKAKLGMSNSHADMKRYNAVLSSAILSDKGRILFVLLHDLSLRQNTAWPPCTCHVRSTKSKHLTLLPLCPSLVEFQATPEICRYSSTTPLPNASKSVRPILPQSLASFASFNAARVVRRIRG